MEKKGLIKPVALTLTFSIAAIAALYIDAKPVWLGLPICFGLVLCAGLIGGEFAGAATGLLSTSTGLYLNIHHYYIPEKLREIPAGLAPDKLEKLEKSIAAFHTEMGKYTDTLSAYSLLIIAVAIFVGFAAGKWLKRPAAAENTEKEKRSGIRKLFDTRTLTYMSMFIALAVAINTFRIGNISFSGFPIIVSGLALGPIYGFIVGGVTDIVGFLVRPSGSAFNIAFTLTSALTGFIPAAMLAIPALKNHRRSPAMIFLAILVGQGVTSVLLVPFFRQWLFEHPLIATMTSAAIKQAYSVPLYAFFYISLDQAIRRNLRLSGKV